MTPRRLLETGTAIALVAMLLAVGLTGTVAAGQDGGPTDARGCRIDLRDGNADVCVPVGDACENVKECTRTPDASDRWYVCELDECIGWDGECDDGCVPECGDDIDCNPCDDGTDCPRPGFCYEILDDTCPALHPCELEDCLGRDECEDDCGGGETPLIGLLEPVTKAANAVVEETAERLLSACIPVGQTRVSCANGGGACAPPGIDTDNREGVEFVGTYLPWKGYDDREPGDADYDVPDHLNTEIYTYAHVCRSTEVVDGKRWITVSWFNSINSRDNHIWEHGGCWFDDCPAWTDRTEFMTQTGHLVRATGSGQQEGEDQICFGFEGGVSGDTAEAKVQLQWCKQLLDWEIKRTKKTSTKAAFEAERFGEVHNFEPTYGLAIEADAGTTVEIDWRFTSNIHHDQHQHRFPAKGTLEVPT